MAEYRYSPFKKEERERKCAILTTSIAKIIAE